ncbi:hypothetical protein CVT24_003580 [Panaeolus cyanescens]|uniref:Endonuclease/exonuclease/phosphatase domain-containing protein n=1 Tax=Panaeolus cyanescens TaxID=181874 RepID=A0A409Y7A7_9AGAR|nr:hypothetical protein CVT24_003580 [Panaeolus cyanescens]
MTTPHAIPSQSRHGLPVEHKQIYSFNTKDNQWLAADPSPSEEGMPLSTKFGIATWNIDFMRQHHELRYKTAFDYLQKTLTSADHDDHATTTIIFIQELEQDFFPVITGHSFVRDCYNITDISSETWCSSSSGYGTITLIPKSLSKYLAAVFRTPFPLSTMGRDALYIDLLLQHRPLNDNQQKNGSQDEAGDQRRYLRLVNVHLESLRGQADIERPMQLVSTVPFLDETNVYAGIVAGDMNPIGPYDAALPEQLGFTDAWVLNKRRRKEDEGASYMTDVDIEQDAESHTWGYQPMSRRYPPNRMDKVLMKGNVDVDSIDRIGVDVRVKWLGNKETPVWASDHYGLLATFRLRGDESS